MKCILCNKNKARRECNLQSGGLICGICCASVRNSLQCAACPHFEQAEQYSKERVRQGHRPEFTMRIDEKVEEEIDRALQQIERGRSQEEAINRIRELYAENPDLCCTQYAMGVIHLVQDDPKQAIVYFQQAVRTFPYFAEAHFNLAACYAQTLDFSKHLRSLQAVCDVAGLGSATRAKAEKMLRETAQKIASTEGISLDEFLKAAEIFEHAVDKMEQGKFQMALADFEVSLKIKPGMPQAYGNMGICFARLGKREQARMMLEKALELDPGYEPARWNLQNLDNTGEKEDIQSVTIQYTALRHLEEEEQKKRTSGNEKRPSGFGPRK